MLIRFRQCPRGLAPSIASMAKASAGDLEDVCRQAVIISRRFRRSRCYRQTGVTDVNLHAGVICADRRIARNSTYANFERLESRVACTIKACCRGTKLESFSARQVAADLAE